MDATTSNGHSLILPTVRDRNRPGVRGTEQAAALQRLTFDAALALRQDWTKAGQLKLTREDATALAQLVRAWDIAANRLRVLRGKGLPASVRSRTKTVSQPEPLSV